MKLTKRKQKYILAKARCPDDIGWVDYFLCNVKSIKDIADKVRQSDIFSLYPGGSVNVYGGDFAIYSYLDYCFDEEEQDAIIRAFLEGAEDNDQSYIDITKKEIDILTEADGYYPLYNMLTVYEKGVTIRARFKHISDEVEADLNI